MNQSSKFRLPPFNNDLDLLSELHSARFLSAPDVFDIAESLGRRDIAARISEAGDQTERLLREAGLKAGLPRPIGVDVLLYIGCEYDSLPIVSLACRSGAGDRYWGRSLVRAIDYAERLGRKTIVDYLREKAVLYHLQGGAAARRKP